jgi:diguanylate cyclase (GGDEF)-like protein/PAS domain S-box-containing protein
MGNTIINHESARLRAVHGLPRLNASCDPELDQMMALVASHFSVPYAYFSILEASVLRIKATYGLHLSDIPRSASFCAHIAVQHQPLVVTDARCDPLFCANPLVIGDPNITFYAGYPVCSEAGFIVGVLSIADRQPREFPDQHMVHLATFARMLENTINQHRIRADKAAVEARLEHAESIMDQAFNQSSAGIALLSLSGRWLAVNSSLCELTGFEADFFDRHAVLDLFHTDESSDPRPLIRNVVDHQLQRQTLECQIKTRQGRPCWVFMTLSLVRDSNQQPLRYVMVLFDISKRKKAEYELQQLRIELEDRVECRTHDLKQAVEQLHREVERRKLAQHQLKRITDNLPVLISHHSADGTYLFANKTYEIYFEQSMSVLGNNVTIASFLGDVVADSCQSYVAEMTLNKTADNLVFDAKLATRRGLVWFSVTLIPEVGGDYYLLLQDITESRKRQKKLEFAALHDGLTKLPNRRAFLWQLQQTMEDIGDDDMQVALLFLDLDGFKALNDTHGHDFGDTVLQTYASIITSSIRPTDFAARLAGDEFTVILRHIKSGHTDIQLICERILTSMRQITSVDNIPVSLACSIGAVLPDPDISLDADYWLIKADEAMYEAKHAGKGTYVIL